MQLSFNNVCFYLPNSRSKLQVFLFLCNKEFVKKTRLVKLHIQQIRLQNSNKQLERKATSPQMDYIIMWVLHDFGNVGKYKGTQSNTFRGLQANSTHLQLYDTQGCQYGLEPRIFSTYITILNPSTLIDKDGIATNATFFFLATFSIFSDTSEITDSLGS